MITHNKIMIFSLWSENFKYKKSQTKLSLIKNKLSFKNSKTNKREPKILHFIRVNNM